MKMKKIIICLLIVIFAVCNVPVSKAEAGSKVNSKSITVDSYDEYWKQFYSLIGKGYNEITLTIKGNDSLKIKKLLDENKESPFTPSSSYAKKYMDKSNWKIPYLIDLFHYKVFHKFDPNEQDYIEENIYSEDEIKFADGYYSITNLSKEMYTKWNDQYYLNYNYEYLWDPEFYSSEESRYMWSEEKKELCVTVELRGKGSFEHYTGDHDNMLKTFSEVKKLIKSWKMDNMTDYQRISKINKYICDHVTYKSFPDQNPGSGANAFLYGEAVCNGYAELMDIFLKTMGYETVLVTAYAEDFDFTNDGHAWNIIKINKKWYAVDTTWNDSQKDSTKYLLVSQKEMKDHNGWALGNYKDYTLSKTRLSKNSKSKLKLTY
ncbi:transglutaminase domain-containing protein [Lachnoclostridium sp.]|uniref:transglutaminase domain-containing protein n=1 Tax=Lachnoclostridium sp. TaxID=2028282 RepID=UPI002896CEC2|nr:transglutaminase domain-containing protein [Lachnoclostridium sp.]